MEETRGRQPLLKVERAFVGSRLEKQILSRAYAFAVPITRKRAETVPSPEAIETTGKDQFSSQRIAQGA
jgi:hypothetical protein